MYCLGWLVARWRNFWHSGWIVPGEPRVDALKPRSLLLSKQPEVVKDQSLAAITECAHGVVDACGLGLFLVFGCGTSREMIWNDESPIDDNRRQLFMIITCYNQFSTDRWNSLLNIIVVELLSLHMPQRAMNQFLRPSHVQNDPKWFHDFVTGYICICITLHSCISLKLGTSHTGAF